jgi:CDP-glucose 4,6-dehydratase
MQHPVETFRTNIMGSVHVLDALRTIGKPVTAVIVTSDKCYRNRETAVPYTENDALGGSDPYTASKACAEIVTGAYRETYFNAGDIRIASARAGNVLGGGDFREHRLVPDLYRAVKNSQPLTLRYPDAVRPWQYVLDVLWGYLTLAAHLAEEGKAFEGEYNFASHSSYPLKVRDIVSQLLQLWGAAHTVIHTEESPAKETRTLLIDPSKAQRVLGWKTQVDDASMLRETAGWYRHLLDGSPALAGYTMAGIDNYLATIL